MLAQPPDSYRGPFPLLDPRFPLISQAHESAEEAWNRAASTKDMQHQAMMRHALRHAPLQQLHAERLGLEGGPDGGMHDRAPMTLGHHAMGSEYHTASEPHTADDDGAWWDTPDYSYVPRSPFHNATQTGLVQHNGTQTEHYGSRQRREEGTDQSEGGAGEGGEGGEAEREARHSLRRYAAAGWNHARPLAQFGGRAIGATGLGAGYAVGALGSLGYHGLRGAANLVYNHVQEGEEEDVEMPEAPPNPRPESTQAEPREPRPVYLIDEEERMNAARQSPPLGAFAQREGARQRAFIEGRRAAYPHWVRVNPE